MKITKPYSAICNAGISITRYRGVSNIIEMQDMVVAKIITQSRYVTKPRKLLQKRLNTIHFSFNFRQSFLRRFNAGSFEFQALTASSYIGLSSLFQLMDLSRSYRTSRKRATDKSYGIYSHGVLRTTVCRRTDDFHVNLPRVDFYVSAIVVSVQLEIVGV